MTNPVFGIKWKHDRLTDLDFADDIALLSDACNNFLQLSMAGMLRPRGRMGLEAKSFGLERPHSFGPRPRSRPHGIWPRPHRNWPRGLEYLQRT